MRMLNMKRAFIVLGFLFTFFFVLVGSSVYFLNVNDYSQWISEQLKQVTGYDVRFEKIENTWFTDKSVSLTGLSLYQQQTRVLFIKRLDLQVDKLDLWQRQLEIASINVNGVELEANKSLLLASAKPTTQVKSNASTEKKVATLQSSSWERLHIAEFQVTGLNATLQTEANSVILKEMDISLNDLLVIDKNQLQQIPKTIDLKSKVSFFKASDSKNNITLKDLQFSINAHLFARQGTLSLEAGEVLVESEIEPILQLQSLDVQLALQRNKLLLQKFLVNAFSGSLALQADAYLAIKLLPQPSIKVNKIELSSLVADNMQFTIPELTLANSSSANNALLPIETLLIKNAQFKNISIGSDTKKIPLTLKSADVQVYDLYVIKDSQWLDPIQDTQQAGIFSLAFEYLQWQEIQVQKFTATGSLNEDDQSMSFLKKILVD